MTTTPSDGLAVDGAERRLHPLSWLFVLIQQLKSFALPILVLLFGPGGNEWELWGLVGAGVLVLVSVARYFTYRYRLDDDGIVVRSGLLQRSLRHVPYARVQNVALHQSLLHRVFGVAEVRLESAAGGVRPEAEMRVLSLADAQALEVLVRGQGRAAATREDGTPDATALPPSQVLLALPTSEVVRLGLISNRGMLVVAAGIGLLAQTGSDRLGDAVAGTGRAVIGWGSEMHLGAVGWVVGGLVLMGFAVVVLRLLSVLLALLQFHGFTLAESGRRLSVQRGLLNRLRANMPRHRIQAWTLRESLMHRWLGRRGLRVDSATVENSNDQRSMRDLAPVATPDAADALVRHLLPGVAWPPTAWRPLHPKAWRRQFAVPALGIVASSLLLAWLHGPWGLAALVLLPVFVLRAVVWARHAGYSADDTLVAVREGWLDRHWRFAEVRKLQALKLVRSPFDRRHGMATLVMDTAGASPLEPPLRVRYLPEAEARALHDRLAATMDAPVTPARTAASAAPAA